MTLIFLYRINNLLMIILTYSAIVGFGKVQFARNTDSVDQIQCFNNLLHNLPNKAFTASSIWQNNSEFEAYRVRMTSMIDTSSDHNGQAWCSHELVSLEPTEWMEIDLGDLNLINSFFTMGRGDGNFKEFTSFFYLEYQRETKHWIRYKNERNEELMVGNVDSRNAVPIRFQSFIVARKVRIYPISKNKPTRACMRILIKGCKFDDGVIEYSMVQGHFYSNYDNDNYDFRDLTYDGDKSKNSLELTGGLGQLMDNILYEGVTDIARTRGVQFIGWNRNILQKHQVEINFKFDQIRKVKNIRIYVLNRVSKNIGYFTSASVHFSIGGKIYDLISPAYFYQTIVDRKKYGSRWIDIQLPVTFTRYLKLKLVFELEWIVLSEIIIISEKSYIHLPIEKIVPIQTLTPKVYNRSYSTYPTKQSPILLVTNHSTATTTNKRHEASFFESSNLGFIVTIASCFFGSLLLFMVFVLGFISIRRCHKRIKRKTRYSDYASRNNGGPFLGDSLIIPLAGGTHSSSGAGSYYYKRPGSADLGLAYPIMGKEYMTLSSKSGTDYDMAGGNSLDGLIPISKDPRLFGLNPHLSMNNYNDNRYQLSVHSRNSNEESFGSSHTEYATTSLYKFNPVLENNANRTTFNQSIFSNSNFRSQTISPIHSNFGGVINNMQGSTPSLQRFGPNQMSDMFPQNTPYRHISQLQENAHTRFVATTNSGMYPGQHFIPENNCQSSQYYPRNASKCKLQGICGNSLMISNNTKSEYISPVSLTDILSNLTEISSNEMELISVVGEGEYGSICFVRSLETEITDRNNISRSTIYLSKSVMHYATNDIRNEIVREMSIHSRIMHSSFLRLSSYTFHHQNTVTTALCFLFQIDDNMENLYTFLRYHSATNPETLPMGHKFPISNVSTSFSLGPSQSYPNIPSLLYICCQISKGMAYLESHQIVHRDLAARNCLLGKNMTVKITDIAMSLPIFNDHYIDVTSMNLQSEENIRTGSIASVSKQNYPLQWMAFESILQGIYSIKTDVWSFGVTMWEILTRCQQPPFGTFGIASDKLIENAYNLSSGRQDAILPNGILSGRHGESTFNRSPSSKDDHMFISDSNLDLNRDAYDLLVACWQRNVLRRPSFDNISTFFSKRLL